MLLKQHRKFEFLEIEMGTNSNFSDPKQGISFNRLQPNSWKVNNSTYSWSPPTDIYKNQEKLIIKIELAGMKQSEIIVNMENNILIVSGTRKEIVEPRLYRQIEIRFGDFRSAIELPDGLDIENTNAEYEDGFLTISIPFTQPKKIKIQG